MVAIRVCNHMGPMVIKNKFHAYFQSFRFRIDTTPLNTALFADFLACHARAFLPRAIFLPKII